MTMPTRTFEAEAGIPSEGTAGPNQIEWDLDNLFAMFNPAALTRDGQPGGISAENIRDGAATDRVIGDRTVSDAEAPTGDTGPLTVILGWLAYQLKAILGSSSWRDQPARTLAQISATVGAAGLLAGVATDTAIGNRTVDQTKTPSSDTGTLTELLGRLANRIRALAGTDDWKDAPPTNLAEVKAHMENETLHQQGFTLNGLSNPGGDITIKAGTGIAVTANPETKEIQIDATGGTAPGPHKETHYAGGSDPIRPEDIGALKKTADDTMTGDLTLAKRALGAALAAIFIGAQTAKDALNFLQAQGSQAEGQILYETSGASGYQTKAVLHLMVGLLNDNDNNYVAIHGKGQEETIKLYTGGDIETPGQIRPGGIAMQGVFNANTANGRCVAPVGADKWAPA